jgi:hypothetical protein
MEIFAQRDLDILRDGQGRKERACLKKDSPAAADILRLVLVPADHVLAEHLDLALFGGLETDDRAHQDRLSGTRSTDDAQDFTLFNVEIEILVNDLLALLAEGIAEAADADDGFFAVGQGR